MDEQMDLKNPGNLKNCSTFLPLSIGGLPIFLCLDLYIDVGQNLCCYNIIDFIRDVYYMIEDAFYYKNIHTSDRKG